MAFGQTNAKTLAGSIDGVLDPNSDNAVKNKVVAAAINNIISSRTDGNPSAGDYMLFYDAVAGAMKKVLASTVMAGYRCSVSGDTLTSKGNSSVSPCPLTKEFDPFGMFDADNNCITVSYAGLAIVTTTRREISRNTFAHGKLKLLVNGAAVKTYDDNQTAMISQTEAAYVPVASGDKISFALETTGDSSDQARVDLVQAIVEIFPGVSVE